MILNRNPHKTDFTKGYFHPTTIGGVKVFQETLYGVDWDRPVQSAGGSTHQDKWKFHRAVLSSYGQLKVGRNDARVRQARKLAGLK